MLKVFLGVDISHQKILGKISRQSNLNRAQAFHVTHVVALVLFCSEVGLFCMPKWLMKELAVMRLIIKRIITSLSSFALSVVLRMSSLHHFFLLQCLARHVIKIYGSWGMSSLLRSRY